MGDTRINRKKIASDIREILRIRRQFFESKGFRLVHGVWTHPDGLPVPSIHTEPRYEKQ